MEREELAEPDEAVAARGATAGIAYRTLPLPRARPAPPSGLELVADLAPPAALAAAVQASREGDVYLLDAVLARHDVDCDAVVRRLGRRLGIATLARGDPLPSAAVLTPEDAAAASQVGILRLAGGGIVAAARGTALRLLVAELRRRPSDRRRVVLATPRAFADLVLAAAGPALVEARRDALERWRPDLTARPLVVARSAAAAAAALVVLAAIVLDRAPLIGHLALSLFFLALAVIRLVAALGRTPRAPAPRRVPDRDLPIYSVVVALYRERRALPGLIDALLALDYPAAKLDIKFAVEADDPETAAALAGLRLPGHIEVLRVAAGVPRTKPRALNVALAAARGRFLVVYDAEDRPDPAQLRDAVAAFAAAPATLACVQAALTIDNSRDSWLTRMFTVEYAALFDAFLPNLVGLRLPFPLGGSSNHFRIEALRRVRGWDAWNVTEDADLGVRLARFGYGMATIASSTYEEAPARLGPWIRQRTRWFKGYVLTAWLHGCRPRRLWHDLGPWRFLGVAAVVAGVPLSALTLPLLLADAVLRAPALLAGLPIDATPLFWIDAANLAAGFGAAAWLGVAGLRRRRLVGYATAMLGLPLYWLLGSVAAYRALYQLAGAPHLWEKTEHGLAQSSRRADGGG